MIMEFCNMGTLASYLEKNKREITIEKIKEIFSQIFHGLNYLFKKNMVHRDLKPDNILLKRSSKSKLGFVIKLEILDSQK
ncbi:serine/threonine-protein kinase ulk3 [Anaeramoeba ignava]|uniref:Serine/threonine-protein kinase ulk3 n=1 Tax=Anaeramoeba ignava TaxID=1746090 RepID=A0A9Q0RC33_ANAIG|nr:serine/threonine-protein kinase ulk3 [Anaeramoeba ignava]